MKSFFTKLTGAALAATVFLASCEKDETQAKLNIAATPQLTSSATTATLSSATSANNAVTYTWTPADFGYQAATTYMLQFAKQGSNFASNVYEVNVGNALTKTFTVGELNSVYEGVDCNSANTATKLDVRVIATVGTAASTATSTTSSIQATPYAGQTAPADKWGIIGSATPGGWDTDTDMTYDFCTRTFKATLPLTAGAFKFRANDAWTLNYGDDANDKALEAGGADIAMTATGTYEVTLNLNATPKPTYTITKK
ncbi:MULTISPECIES: SusE domain-containing protein [Hymenobacter]|uniref:SusE outer membrane protein domain-containing protein n=1 Tax=Hymenobacter mucosus TaxID=1411120 RepID=A0A238VI21_9BACT|nr:MULTISPECIES: SusE domain-containing protein [Hymenobacter]SNR33824.1 protein of unknown function [Hymenobacter mucosus]